MSKPFVGLFLRMKNYHYPDSEIFPKELTEEEFTKLVLKGVVVDGRLGGLIVGKTYAEGGVYVCFKLGVSYVVQGWCESGEFVLNKEASSAHYNRIAVLRANVVPAETISEERPDYSWLITYAEPDDRLLWLDWGQTVLAKETTIRYYDELLNLNSSHNPYTLCDLAESFGVQRSKDVNFS